MKHFFAFIFPVILYVTACSSPMSTGDENLKTNTVGFTLQEASHITLWLENFYKTTVLMIWPIVTAPNSGEVTIWYHLP